MTDSWDLYNMKPMKDDCLWFVKMLYIELYLHKYSIIGTCVILFFHVSLWIAHIYYFFKTLDVQLVVQYGPASLMFFYGFISILIPIYYEKELLEYNNIMKTTFWSYDTGSQELQTAISKKAKYFVYIAKINVVLGVVTYITVLLRARGGREWELFYAVTFIKDHFPEHQHILIIIYYISMMYFIIPMMLMVYTLAYYVMHVSFQAKLVNERILKVTENYPNDLRLTDDEGYQKQVFERYGFCIKRLLMLKSLSEVSIGYISHFCVVYIVLAILLMVCFLGTWYLDPDKYIPHVLMLVTVSCYTGLVAVEIGQLVEDESLDTYFLINELPWYTFSVRNQKIVLFTLLHALKPIKVSHYEAFPVNRRMIVQFYKIFTTLSAWIVNTREKIFK